MDNDNTNPNPTDNLKPGTRVRIGNFTGRLPNLPTTQPEAQNIPIPGSVRAKLSTELSKQILEADFSAVELRVAAQLGNSPATIPDRDRTITSQRTISDLSVRITEYADHTVTLHIYLGGELYKRVSNLSVSQAAIEIGAAVLEAD